MRRRILSRLCPNVLRIRSLVDSLPSVSRRQSSIYVVYVISPGLSSDPRKFYKESIRLYRKLIISAPEDGVWRSVPPTLNSARTFKWKFFSCVTEIAPSSGTRLRSNPLHPQDYGPTRITWCYSSATRWSTQALVPSATHNRQLEVNWKNCRTKEKVL